MPSSSRVPWRSVAPVLPDYVDAQRCLWETFDFGLGVKLGLATEWPIPDTCTEGLSKSDAYLVRIRRFSFAVDYFDGGVIDSSWNSDDPKHNFETAMIRLHYANLALWLTRITPLSYMFVFHFHEKSPNGYVVARNENMWEPLTCTPRYAEAHLQPGDLEAARVRFQNLYALGPTGTVATTIRLLMKTVSDREAISSFMGLWTCIEALFGPEKAEGGLTHKLAERVALFLHGRSEQAFGAFSQFKKDYGLRSRVVHGLKTEKKDPVNFPEVQARTEEWLRLPLQRIADSQELAAKFNGEARDAFLKRLPFSSDPSGPEAGGLF